MKKEPTKRQKRALLTKLGWLRDKPHEDTWCEPMTDTEYELEAAYQLIKSRGLLAPVTKARKVQMTEHNLMRTALIKRIKELVPCLSFVEKNKVLNGKQIWEADYSKLNPGQLLTTYEAILNAVARSFPEPPKGTNNSARLETKIDHIFADTQFPNPGYWVYGRNVKGEAITLQLNVPDLDTTEAILTFLNQGLGFKTTIRTEEGDR